MEAGMERVAGARAQLVEIHDALREELAELRASRDAHLRAGRAADLRAHCVAFCGAVTRHHTAEDGGVFDQLRQQFPELAPVIDKLIEDHALIAGLLQQLETTEDFDGIAAILESHFSFEERRLGEALDRLENPPPLW
jgi:hypothetical protein